MQVLRQIQKEESVYKQAAHVLKTTKVQQCFYAARKGKKMCAFAVIRKAGVDLPHYVNGAIIAKNDLDHLSFTEIGDWLEKL